MLDFHGLTPDPCPRCKNTDNLRFFEWVEGRRTVTSFRTAQGIINRPDIVELKVLFECTVDGFLLDVPVSWDRRPPEEWTLRGRTPRL